MTNPDLSAVAASLNALNARQVRVLTGTVSGSSSNSQTVPVRLDNEGDANNIVPVIIPSIVGLLEVGARVSILTVPPAGMMIVGVIGADYDLQALWDYQVLVTNNPVWEDRQFYTTPGVNVWNKPTSPLFLGVTVKLQAGGGASGGIVATPATDTSCSGPGQGGGYAEFLILASSLTATVNATVGAGGAIGAVGNNAGGTGGTSSFGAYAAVSGGVGGAGANSAAAGQTFQAGGTSNQFASLVVAGGAILMDFQQGDDGISGFRFANTIIMPGAGGGSRMAGITKISPIATGQIAPSGGWPFGGGASGRGINGVIVGGGGVAATAGAAGGQGCVIVNEWYRT